MARLCFREVPAREAEPAKAPDEIDPYRAIEAARQRHEETLRQARSRYDAELHAALRQPDAHALVDAARAQLERDLAEAARVLADALVQAGRKLYMAPTTALASV
jgi:hypothetical protein